LAARDCIERCRHRYTRLLTHGIVADTQSASRLHRALPQALVCQHGHTICITKKGSTKNRLYAYVLARVRVLRARPWCACYRASAHLCMRAREHTYTFEPAQRGGATTSRYQNAALLPALSLWNTLTHCDADISRQRQSVTARTSPLCRSSLLLISCGTFVCEGKEAGRFGV